MSKGTDRRTVRIAPEIWDAARAVAAERNETVSDVVRRALVEYVKTKVGIMSTSDLDRADEELIKAVMVWSVDHDRARADRELREAILSHRLASDAVRDSVRALCR